ncbi:MAG: ABC transporter permease [Actinocatenispora sp.]
MSAPDQAAAGTIHDIGYQRYTGVRLGRGHAVRSLYTYSFRTAFGLGRSGKAKIFPFLVAGILLVVGVVLAAIRAQLGVNPLTYLDFPVQLSFLLVLFLAAVTPELASRDLRNQVLPLYFSRPIGRDDYVLAKLGALVTAVLLVLGTPMFVMFLGGAFSADSAGGVWDEFTDLIPGLLNAAIYAIVLSAVTLLVASVTSRRTIAAGAVVAVFLVPTAITGVLMVLGGGAVRQLSSLFSVTGILNGVRTWLFGDSKLDIGSFGPLYAAAAVILVGLATVLLVYRYRKVAA